MRLPDPGPIVTADVRRWVEDSGLGLDGVAQAVARACRTDWVDGALIERWLAGQHATLLAVHERALRWLAGQEEVPPAV